MDAEHFTRALGPLAPRHRVTWYDVIDSTNTRALDALAKGTARDGDVFIAARQTAGRGTDGHTWVSDERLGLWMSIVFTEPLRIRPLSLLPAVALAIVLRRDFSVPAHLKWPNDVLAGAGEDTRKIAGILVESDRSTTCRGWAVGVGVNLNHDRFEPPLDRIATSLRMQTGSAASVPQFFASLILEMDRLSDSAPGLTALWTELSRMPGRTVRLRRGKRDVFVRVDGIDESGHLLLTHEDGHREMVVGAAGLDIAARY
jgi:BirA family biotin operon repressor/biotin-[acetyl-CoA-carboxylase] ligase